MLERYRRKREKMDVWLALAVFSLTVFGVIMIASASVVAAYEQYGGKNDYAYVFRQIWLVLVGMGLLVFFSNFDYRRLRSFSTPLLIIAIVTLVAVFIPGIGKSLGGATRWIQLGPIWFQPSELMKLAFIIFLAHWLEKQGEKISTFAHGLLPFISMLGVLSFLIIKQPDLGTLSVLLFSSIVMFYIAGASYYHLFYGGVILSAVFFIFVRFSAYRWQRFLTFLNPSAESLGASYHINQAFLAIGSGGLFGLGFGQSIQKYRYLPEPFTDSIFAIIAEELGFLRAAMVLLVFAFIAWRGYRIARGAPDNFSRYLAYGITSWITIQAMMNISTMIGLIPLTGVPLPFISYGRTALITTLIAVGILLNISRQSVLEKTNERSI